MTQRLNKHNSGGSKSTKIRRPFVLIYSEQYLSKQAAISREKWSKTLEGGSRLVELLIDKEILSLDKKLKM